MPDRFDVVAVGGGIAGSGCATVLARAGLDVLVLEPTTEFPDIVRGEWLAPWGVAEAKRTGLYDILKAAGGHHVASHVTFSDDWSADDAMAGRLPLDAFVPGVEGPLCIRHPVACQALADAAAHSGAVVRRGARGITVRGTDVSWEGGSAECRLVIGADGRASPLRRGAGIELLKSETDHYLGGILLDGVDWWPEDVEVAATQGSVHVLAFPQGNGRLRMYLAYPTGERDRFAGADRATALIRAFAVSCWPGSEKLADAEVAGPAHSYGSADTWTERPFADGLVLAGDAAGYNDPIIGQGLSIAMRDIRLVTDAIQTDHDFAPYAEERMERMRRLRFAAQVYAVGNGGQGAGRDADERRRVRDDPMFPIVLAAAMMGPDVLPADTFSDETRERLLG